jgi:hypothetical protein
MKKHCFFTLGLLFVLFAFSQCNQESIVIDYQTDMEEFVNPERGFYRPKGTKTSSFEPLDAGELLKLREPSPAAGGFKVGSTLTYRSYRLDTFKDQALSEEILANIQSDMDIIREVGNKIILRFSYSASCCDPPFNDAPKDIILQHLNQLQAIFSKNKDVIAVVQMGLIGPWGEQFYSDHFGDLEHGPVTDQHWIDRGEIISKLLEVVPESRMIQVRAPYYKLRFLDGKKAHPEHAIPLSIEEAFNGTPLARLAHHNDCILANYDDYWTYHSFHEWPAESDTTNLKPYVASETKFLVFGGETCPGGDDGEDVYNPYNNCISDGGSAQHYLKRFHTSFLNTSWSGAINGDWNNKCIDEIKRNLGYRFVLKRGVYPGVIRNGQKLKMQLDFVNEGYASTYNSRHVELVLRSIEDQKVYKMKLDCDPRYWFPDELHTLKIDLELPEVLPGGQYELFINLPDPESSLYHRPEYAIRLASKYESSSIWDPTTGWNVLLPSIKVE